MSLPNHFELLATDGSARTGRLTTPHGMVRTPVFMPVGTAGAMKGVHWREVREAGSDIVLGNTYHLMLRPGAERIAALGGLQRFTGWGAPMLTDSGGFQVMSLSELRKVTEDAVTFRSLSSSRSRMEFGPSNPASCSTPIRTRHSHNLLTLGHTQDNCGVRVRRLIRSRPARTHPCSARSARRPEAPRRPPRAAAP